MINERLFGSPIPPEVKKKLEDRQRVAGEVAAGESIEAVYPDKNGNNQADLSSRTPFVRMWTSVKLIDPSEIENALEQITKQEYEDFRTNLDAPINKKFDELSKQYDNVHLTEILVEGVEGKDARYAYFIIGDPKNGDPASAKGYRDQVDYARQVYIIGDYNYQTSYGEVEPNESNQPEYMTNYVNDPYDDFPDVEGEEEEIDWDNQNPKIEEARNLADSIFQPELSTNPLLKPQSGITKVTTETAGALGVIKKTTISFTVHNFYDYDRIFNKYFLKPGATVFVDFGWSSVKSLYNPEEMINNPKGVEHFLYNNPSKDNNTDKPGEITKNQGDLEVLMGIVTDYNSKIEINGSVTCELTITSANSALLDLETNTEVVTKIKGIVDRGLIFLGVQAVMRSQNQESDYAPVAIAGMMDIVTGADEDGDGLISANESNDLVQLLNTPDASNSAQEIEAYGRNLSLLGQTLLTSVNGVPTGNAVRTGVFVEHLDFDNTYMSFGLFEDLIINSQFGFGKNEDSIQKGRNFEVKLDSSYSFTKYSKSIVDQQNIMLTVSEPTPTFLFPAWWGNVEDYDGFKNKNEHGYNKVDQLELQARHTGERSLPGSYNFQNDKWAKQDPTYLDFVNDGDYTPYENGAIKMVGIDKFMNRIPIREIFIDTKIIVQAFEQNDSVLKAIKQILDEINEYSSGIMNLNLIKGKTESEISVVDMNYVETDQNDLAIQEANFNDLFTFDIMSPNSIVKDYNLQFKLPSGNIGNMYAIQSMGHGDNIFSVNESILDMKNLNKLDNKSLSIIYEPDLGTFRLKQYAETHNNSSDFNVYNQINKMFSTDVYNVQTDIYTNYNQLIAGVSPEMMFKADDEVVKAAKTAKDTKAIKEEDLIKTNDAAMEAAGFKVAQTFADYYGMRKSQEVSSEIPSALFPFTLTLTTYGIASVQPGDTFRVNYLPKNYLEKTYLQIVKVSHDVGPEGWYTTFDTQFRLRAFETAVHEGNSREIRLSGNALINLGLVDQLTLDDTWDDFQFPFGGTDTVITLKQIIAYATDFRVKSPADFGFSSVENKSAQGIDFIIDFEFTEKIAEVIKENKSLIQNGQVIGNQTTPFRAKGTDFRATFDTYDVAQDALRKAGLGEALFPDLAVGMFMFSAGGFSHPLFNVVMSEPNAKGKEDRGWYDKLTGQRTVGLDFNQWNPDKTTIDITPKNVVIKPNTRYQLYVLGNLYAIVDKKYFAELAVNANVGLGFDSGAAAGSAADELTAKAAEIERLFINFWMEYGGMYVTKVANAPSRT